MTSHLLCRMMKIQKITLTKKLIAILFSVKEEKHRLLATGIVVEVRAVVDLEMDQILPTAVQMLCFRLPQTMLTVPASTEPLPSLEPSEVTTGSQKLAVSASGSQGKQTSILTPKSQQLFSRLPISVRTPTVSAQMVSSISISLLLALTTPVQATTTDVTQIKMSKPSNILKPAATGEFMIRIRMLAATATISTTRY